MTELTNPRALVHAHTTSFAENGKDDMADEKPDGKPDEMTDAARLRDWMDGDKITIVLKRQKEKKEKKEKKKSDQA